jgi:hypothetical protein
MVLSLRNLRFSYIRDEGYVNLRCVWMLGCPDEIRPAMDAFAAAIRDPASNQEVTARDIFKGAFEELLPEMNVPEVVGVPCCSQFAVTREAIRRRPREDYMRFRTWLLETPLDDSLSGRVLEYSWHSKSMRELVRGTSLTRCLQSFSGSRRYTARRRATAIASCTDCVA